MHWLRYRQVLSSNLVNVHILRCWSIFCGLERNVQRLPEGYLFSRVCGKLHGLS